MRLVVVVLLVIGASAAVVRGVYGELEGAQASKDFKWTAPGLS